MKARRLFVMVLLAVVLLLAASCSFDTFDEGYLGYYQDPYSGSWKPVTELMGITESPPSGTTTVTVSIVWGWDVERQYSKGQLCWLGYDSTEEQLVDWISLQDGNIGHRPTNWNVEPASPDWWARWKQQL